MSALTKRIEIIVKSNGIRPNITIHVVLSNIEHTTCTISITQKHLNSVIFFSLFLKNKPGRRPIIAFVMVNKGIYAPIGEVNVTITSVSAPTIAPAKGPNIMPLIIIMVGDRLMSFKYAPAKFIGMRKNSFRITAIAIKRAR